MTYEQACDLVDRLTDIDIDRNDGVPGLYAIKNGSDIFHFNPDDYYVICNERGRIDDPDYGTTEG